MKKREFIKTAIDLYTKGELHSFKKIYRVMLLMDDEIGDLTAEVKLLKEEIYTLKHILSTAVVNTAVVNTSGAES